MADQCERGEQGASAVEYGLLVAGIAALICGVVFFFGGMLNEIFAGTCDSIKDGSSPTSIVATCP